MTAGEASGWVGREVSLMPIAGLCSPVGQAAQGSNKLLCHDMVFAVASTFEAGEL